MHIQSEVPCVDSTQQNNYLRDPEVMDAMHCNPEITWEICSSSLRYTKSLGSNSFQFYDFILQNNVRIWHFFGEDDGAVPMKGGEKWSKKLGYTVTETWRKWFVQHTQYGRQVAGYTVDYDAGNGIDFRFITVKAAWHTVPESHPEESLYMLEQFLLNEPL